MNQIPNSYIVILQYVSFKKLEEVEWPIGLFEKP
jgi:hypothetical protein